MCNRTIVRNDTSVVVSCAGIRLDCSSGVLGNATIEDSDACNAPVNTVLLVACGGGM